MSDPIVPVQVVVQFGHGVAQRIADEAGVRLLHLKGAATDRRLWHDGEPRMSTDGDVLVHPDQVDGYLERLVEDGWELETDFAHGSSFEHAATLRHETWGYLDVHRSWPGFARDPAEVFETLWHDRQQVTICAISCATPSLPDQRIILSINAVRDGADADHPDVAQAWQQATPQLRSVLLARADRLGGQVAFSIVTGDFDRHRDHPQHAIWQVMSEGGSRREEWVARVRAAPDLRTGARTAVRSVLVNPQSLRVRLGHPPSRVELARDFVGRFARAVRDELRS
ncbi:2-nitropropane dioxygenase [Flexivirga sp. ID2601S]|uniref:2-nitropropane dioxygenase n=1 Tax=Flexivirga aerilata TaxID=1656889 RepID=A0A849AI08_9MICO|nr:nucleotidyltransferase family protein [Flexivirga aerilata]NNG40085.1 2-nitropropane dioxygenase [Flexivirga aerilata]